MQRSMRGGSWWEEESGETSYKDGGASGCQHSSWGDGARPSLRGGLTPPPGGWLTGFENWQVPPPPPPIAEQWFGWGHSALVGRGFWSPADSWGSSGGLFKSPFFSLWGACAMIGFSSESYCGGKSSEKWLKLRIAKRGKSGSHFRRSRGETKEKREKATIAKIWQFHVLLVFGFLSQMKDFLYVYLDTQKNRRIQYPNFFGHMY